MNDIETNKYTSRDISIVIPFFNKWDLTHRVLMQLKLLWIDVKEIILVDDASNDVETIRSKYDFWKNIYRDNNNVDIKYIRNSENKGFGYSMNRGMSSTSGNIIVLLSNDVEVKKDFVVPMLKIFNENPRSLVTGAVVDFRGGWNDFEYDGERYAVPYANGWFLAATRDGFKEIGFFDKLFYPFDYEDVDLSVRFLLRGYKIVPLMPDYFSTQDNPMFIHQQGSTVSSLNLDRTQVTIDHKNKFFNKWTPAQLYQAQRSYFGDR